MVRNERFRLIQYEDGSLEFYDMQKDPDEWNNLADNVSCQEEIARLKQFIPGEWADLSSFSKYDINPYFKEKTDDQ